MVTSSTWIFWDVKNRQMHILNYLLHFSSQVKRTQVVTKIVSENDPRSPPCQLDTSFTFEGLTFFYSKSLYISSNSGAKPSVRATESKDNWTVCLNHDASKLPPRPTWRTAFSHHPCTSLRNILKKRNWNILELAPYTLNPDLT